MSQRLDLKSYESVLQYIDYTNAIVWLPPIAAGQQTKLSDAPTLPVTRKAMLRINTSVIQLLTSYYL